MQAIGIEHCLSSKRVHANTSGLARQIVEQTSVMAQHVSCGRRGSPCTVRVCTKLSLREPPNSACHAFRSSPHRTKAWHESSAGRRLLGPGGAVALPPALQHSSRPSPPHADVLERCKWTTGVFQTYHSVVVRAVTSATSSSPATSTSSSSSNAASASSSVMASGIPNTWSLLMLM